MAVRNSSNYVEFEHQNCSVLVRLLPETHDDQLQNNKRNKLVENFNFEQAQVVPVFLFRMNVGQNETGSRFKFSLSEDAAGESNQLDECFEISAEGGEVF